MLYDPIKTTSILEMSFNMEIFYSGSSQNSDLGQEQLYIMEESAEADNTKRATKWGLKYAIPKINMLCNLCCLKTRLRLLCNKSSTAQKPEPRFKTA